MWVRILPVVFLGICAISDGLRREIPLAAVWLGIAAAVVLRICGLAGDGSLRSALLSVLPGLLFWMLGFVSREKVGYGDGWMLVMIGLYTGLWKCFLILTAGLVSSSVAALLLLACKRITREYQLPFAPFLLIGMGVVWGLPY